MATESTRKTFTDEEKQTILAETATLSLAAVSEKYHVSVPTLYQWRKKAGNGNGTKQTKSKNVVTSAKPDHGVISGPVTDSLFIQAIRAEVKAQLRFVFSQLSA